VHGTGSNAKFVEHVNISLEPPGLGLEIAFVGDEKQVHEHDYLHLDGCKLEHIESHEGKD